MNTLLTLPFARSRASFTSKGQFAEGGSLSLILRFPVPMQLSKTSLSSSHHALSFFPPLGNSRFAGCWFAVTKFIEHLLYDRRQVYRDTEGVFLALNSIHNLHEVWARER